MAVWIWANYETSLPFSFLICGMKIITPTYIVIKGLSGIIHTKWSQWVPVRRVTSAYGVLSTSRALFWAPHVFVQVWPLPSFCRRRNWGKRKWSHWNHIMNQQKSQRLHSSSLTPEPVNSTPGSTTSLQGHFPFPAAFTGWHNPQVHPSPSHLSSLPWWMLCCISPPISPDILKEAVTIFSLYPVYHLFTLFYLALTYILACNSSLLSTFCF